MLVIDSQIAGISGDMLLCSLVDMGAGGSGIIDGVRTAQAFLDGAEINDISFVKTKKRGIRATGLELDLRDGSGTRRGTAIRDCIRAACGRIGLSESASGFADSSIKTLIDAESRIHGEPPDSVHFHEASSFDTVIDILGTSIALDDLQLFGERIACTPVAVGGGSVTFSHGTASNPAGAVLEILRGSGILISGTGAGGELTTPTGACMLRNLAAECVGFYPTMRVDAVGYGAGTRDFEDFSNVLKLVRGADDRDITHDSVTILETNVDDVSGELLGNVIERLVQRGAKDVTVSPAVTKKGRPSHLVAVICSHADAGALADLLMSETGTLGVRVRTSGRITARRHQGAAEVRIGGRDYTVRYKTSGVSGAYKIESDDVRAVSESAGRPYRETEELIRGAIDRKAKP